MSSTPYRAINFVSDDLISDDKMEQLVSNTQWLYDNTPRTTYTLPSGLHRAENIRMASGRAIVTARKADNAQVNVNFTNLFSQGCEPIITTGICSIGQAQIFAVINGLGTRLTPDYRGFQIFVNIAAQSKKNDRIKRNLYVTWIAMGY